MSVDIVLKNVHAFTQAAYEIFGSVEDSQQSRTMLLRTSYNKLDSFTPVQDDTLRQALRCVESELFRAAHVMAWSAAIDYLQSWCADDGFVLLNEARSNWNISSIDDLRERFGEHAIIEAMRVAKLLTKNEQKAFHGMLSKRNECAHPSEYFPDLNQTLGYISEILNRLSRIEKRR